MSLASTDNPRIPVFLRIVTIIECLVVFTAAFVLFFFPQVGKQVWSWAVPPYNSRYIGAIYFAALLPLVIFAISGKWSPGRMVLWMIFTFTFSIGVVMFIHVSAFDWTRWSTYAFWFLYLFLPLNSAIHLFLYRRTVVQVEKTAPLSWRRILLVISFLLAVYGMGLLLFPEFTASFWPWSINAFHGRIYAATFFTPAVGAWIVSRKHASVEVSTLGLTLVTLGIFSLAGLLWASSTLPPENQVDFGDPGTWLFLGMNIVITLAGVAIGYYGRKLDQPLKA